VIKTQTLSGVCLTQFKCAPEMLNMRHAFDIRDSSQWNEGQRAVVVAKAISERAVTRALTSDDRGVDHALK
jgi:hypothetical protein